MVNGRQRKLVAIYDRVFDLAISKNWKDLQRLIGIVAIRGREEVRLAARTSTEIVVRNEGNVIDRSPLLSAEE